MLFSKKELSTLHPRNKSIVVTNQQGHPKTATNEESKRHLLQKVFLVKVLKRKLLWLQEVKLKYFSLKVGVSVKFPDLPLIQVYNYVNINFDSFAFSFFFLVVHEQKGGVFFRSQNGGTFSYTEQVLPFKFKQ